MRASADVCRFCRFGTGADTKLSHLSLHSLPLWRAALPSPPRGDIENSEGAEIFLSELRASVKYQSLGNSLYSSPQTICIGALNYSNGRLRLRKIHVTDIWPGVRVK